jgi:hypothetical protein
VQTFFTGERIFGGERGAAHRLADRGCVNFL